jgi:hypothetical protein
MNQKLLDLYRETARLTNTTEAQVETVISELWYGVRGQISKTQGNNILLHYLGNFEIPKRLLDKYIAAFEKSYQNGDMTKRRYDKGIESLKRLKEQNES